MDKELLKILKELKQVRPDPAYSRQSRLLILGPEVKQGGVIDILSNFYSVRLALAGIAIVLILVAGSVYYINNQLKQNDLVVKASEMNTSIQVKLNEIKYLLENKPVNASDASTIQALLEKAVTELKEASNSSTSTLDVSLEKIKSAQETLYQIDALLKQ